MTPTIQALTEQIKSLVSSLRAGTATVWQVVNLVIAIGQFVSQFGPQPESGKILFGASAVADDDENFVNACRSLCEELGCADHPVFEGVIADRIGEQAMAAVIAALKAWLAKQGVSSIMEFIASLLVKPQAA